MGKILMYISNIIIVLSFLGYFILILRNRKNNIKADGFNITKDILDEYNSINIIENSGYFTMYSIKRKVIKIATRCYYGNSISDVSIPLIEAGISVVDSNKNKFINVVGKIFSNLKYLYLFPIIAIGINSLTYNVSDSKVSIAFLILFSFICYLFIEVKTNATFWIENNLSKIKNISNDDKVRIVNFNNLVLFFDKLIFISELIMILRFVLIILDMS